MSGTSVSLLRKVASDIFFTSDVQMDLPARDELTRIYIAEPDDVCFGVKIKEAGGAEELLNPENNHVFIDFHLVYCILYKISVY